SAGVIERKHSVDQRINELQGHVEAARRREAILQHEIDAASAQIRGLEQQVGDVAGRLVPLERELRLRELKLNRLNALVPVQSEQLSFLRSQSRTAIKRLNERLVAAYQEDTPDALAVLLSARNLGDMLDAIDYVRTIARYDQRVVEEVTAARRQVAAGLTQTKMARAGVRQQAQIVAVRLH